MKMAKGATSPRMIAFLETVPLAVLLLIAFGGSCNNIFHVFGACGTNGVFQYGDTGAPDLLCLVAFREKIRDDRLHRDHKGWLSWPATIILFGIFLTLALGYLGSDKNMLSHLANSWTGHALGGVLPGSLLLLGLSMFHRRDAGTAKAGTVGGRRRAAAGTVAKATEAAASTATPVLPPAEPVPTPADPAPAAVPAASTGEGEGSGPNDDGQPPAERSFDLLLDEARKYRDELAARGEGISKDKIRLRLKVGNSTALELARVVKAEAAEAAERAEAVS